MPMYPAALDMRVAQGTIGNPVAQPRIVPVGVIVHTNASDTSLETLQKAYTIGSGYGGGEAHFDIETHSPPGRRAGRLAQFVDTALRADNNFHANSYVQGGVLKGWISIESGDVGQPYTASFSDLGQRQQLEDLLVWICRTHGIPPIRATDPYGTGIGWHSMWGYNHRGSEPGRYGRFTASDGTIGALENPWTNTYGKICPGPGPGVPGGKIGEMGDLIAAVARRLSDNPPTPDPLPSEDDMPDFIITVVDGTSVKYYLVCPNDHAYRAVSSQFMNDTGKSKPPPADTTSEPLDWRTWDKSSFDTYVAVKGLKLS